MPRPSPDRLPAASLLLALAACGGSARTGPNVVLVTLDTTRADHMSCYGYEKPTTPRLDELARDGLVYERAIAVTSWTLPSHASLFTGKYPTSHGAMYTPEGKIRLTDGIKGNPAWDLYRANPIADDQVTLAQVLGEAGWTTGAIVAGPWLKQVFGLDRGFASYDDENFVDQGQGVGELNGRTAEDVTRAAIEFVDENADRPFFLFLNYYDPHSPYVPHGELLPLFWQREWPETPWPWEFQLALYDNEIRYTDHHFGRLLDHLKAKGLYEGTWILVTADHGELMGEHGAHGHGNSLSQEEIHVPLLVKEPGPERPRGRVDRLVSQADVLPTLLERLGLPLPPDVQGVPLDRDGRTVVAEVYPLPMMNANPNLPDRQLGDWRVLLDGRWKFVWGSRGKHYLFDLEADPRERTNRIEDEPEVAERLRRRLEAFLAGLPRPGRVSDVELDPAEHGRLLEALDDAGYIGGDGQEAPRGEEGE